MSFQVNVPPSVVSKLSKNADKEMAEPEELEKPATENKKQDWRKLKELEEARKAGTAPAMQDEEGKDINPHIPQYIMQAPWYFGAEQATLRHQRVQDEKIKSYAHLTDWYKRGVKEGPVVTKFRKGACENCGAMTHIKKDCVERPRKVGAKFTGTAIAPDEHDQPELDHDFDGKRDRWNGYDLAEHKRIVEEFQKIDEAKRQLKATRVDDSAKSGEVKAEEAEKDIEDEDEEDEDKYADDVDMPGQKFETKQRITVRNLRIREDTAKYLYNLDVNSAYYDPKTRSMRENPFKTTGKEPKELPYAGDNFVRWSGGSMGMAEQQMFAWQAYEKGTDVHLQADPTKLDILQREYQHKKDDYKNTLKSSILDRYGGLEHLEAPPKQLLIAQSDNYVEYSRQGKIIKGNERAKVKSRYEEDVYPSNHTSVWGSYWKDGQWGFHCCNSLIRESYCTGSAGKFANENALPGIDMPEDTRVALLDQAEEGEIIDKEAEEEAIAQALFKEYMQKLKEKKQRRKEKNKRRKEKQRAKNKKKKKKNDSDSSSSSSSSSESEDEEAAKERKIQEALKKMDAEEKVIDEQMQLDERKRGYNITYNFKGPTDEEMEAFKRKRQREEDPMSQF